MICFAAGVEDDDDNCPLRFNIDQSDIDNDGKGDSCDMDKDGDGELLRAS